MVKEPRRAPTGARNRIFFGKNKRGGFQWKDIKLS